MKIKCSIFRYHRHANLVALIYRLTFFGLMIGWKVAPFIEAVDAQEHSHFIVR